VDSCSNDSTTERESWEEINEKENGNNGEGIISLTESDVDVEKHKREQDNQDKHK